MKKLNKAYHEATGQVKEYLELKKLFKCLLAISSGKAYWYKDGSLISVFFPLLRYQVHLPVIEFTKYIKL